MAAAVGATDPESGQADLSTLADKAAVGDETKSAGSGGIVKGISRAGGCGSVGGGGGGGGGGGTVACCSADEEDVETTCWTLSVATQKLTRH